MLFDFICVLMIFVVCCFAVSLVVVYLCWLVGFVCCVFVQGAMVPIGVLPGLRVVVFWVWVGLCGLCSGRLLC